MSKLRIFWEYILAALTVAVPLYLLFSVRLQTSDNVVSGIVYNNQNNSIFTSNTYFRVRASENTVVTKENISKFCLPPNSPYIKLVNEAAKDKSIKVVVTSSKVFTMVLSPWHCVDNVKVERLN
ncbi:MAG: hypothetical protein HXO49_09530 [Prevotella sp.]|nr:hypothetical protein [Prevotella sp.]